VQPRGSWCSLGLQQGAPLRLPPGSVGHDGLWPRHKGASSRLCARKPLVPCSVALTCCCVAAAVAACRSLRAPTWMSRTLRACCPFTRPRARAMWSSPSCWCVACLGQAPALLPPASHPVCWWVPRPRLPCCHPPFARLCTRAHNVLWRCMAWAGGPAASSSDAPRPWWCCVR